MKEVPGRVLLADDERTFALTTARVLERHGLTCDWVLSADEAREAMSVRDYAVVVADIKMPGNSELDFFRSLRADEDAPTVILITGYPSVDTAVRSLELGAFAYLVKPFELEDLIEKVRDGLRHAALRRKLGHRSAMAAELRERLQALRGELDRAGGHALDQTAGEYLNLLLLGAGDTVLEAAEVLRLMQCGNLQRPLREIAEHPEVEMLRNAVDETVQVLERTRRNFKSRELALLRKRLERLLELTGEKSDQGLERLN